MVISVHDSVVKSYQLNFDNQELCMQVETPFDGLVNIKFEEYLVHHFQHVRSHSILFDIEEWTIAQFIESNKEQMEQLKAYSWPIFFEDSQELQSYLVENDYICFVILTSYGLNGYVLAKKIIKKKMGNFSFHL